MRERLDEEFVVGDTVRDHPAYAGKTRDPN